MHGDVTAILSPMLTTQGHRAAWFRFAFLTLLAVQTAALPALAADTNIRLRFTAVETRTERKPAPDLALQQNPFLIKVRDSRPGDQQVVGENNERNTPRVIRALNPIAGFVAEGMTSSFSAWGARVSASSPKILSVEVQRLFVAESNRYRAEVFLLCSLHAADSGALLWSNVIGGSAGKWGRSMSEENYCEVLSDALDDASWKIFTDDSFRAALAGRKDAPRDAPATQATLALSPEDLKQKVLLLIKEGFAESDLVSYARRASVTRSLTAEEMVEWKNAGIPPAVISAVGGRREN